MMVKICGITCAEDVRAAVDSGASALGFNFYPKSPRSITPEAAADLARLVPKGVWKVGIFVSEPATLVRDVSARVPLDVAQIHGDCEIPDGIRIWRAVAAGPGLDPAVFSDPRIEAVLVDTPAGPAHGGTGMTFDWSLAAGLPGRIVLAGGLGPDNVADAIRAARPWGVDACSRLESAPGKKDNRKVKEFIANALGVMV